MSTPQHWQEAHYALGRYELDLGHPLDWRGRETFIKDYLAQIDREENDGNSNTNS